MIDDPEQPAQRASASSAPLQPAYEPAAGPPPADSGQWQRRLPGQLATVALAVLAGAIGAQLMYLLQGIWPRPMLEGEPPYPAATVAASDRAALADLALGGAVVGALIAAALGAALWLLRGSSRSALTGVLVGLLSGALLGGLGGALNLFTHRQLSAVELDELFRAMIVHAPFWICLSLAIAMTFGLSLRGVSTLSIFGATIGAAILASLLYPLAMMVLFPAARADKPVLVEFGARMLWAAIGAAMLSWAAARSVSASRFPASHEPTALPDAQV